MKKIFTLAAAMFVSFSLFAATETTANVGTADNAVVGTSFTIPGAYIAGKGGTQITPMPNKGIKVRLNAASKGGANNTIPVNVNDGYKITSLKFTGVTNNDATSTFSDITVDNVAWNGAFTPTLPAKNASAAAEINITGINAEDSIVFHFSEGGATQANICLEITYEITATTHIVAYKSNDELDATVTDDVALQIADNMFAAAAGFYFNGWNTAADGTGNAYAVGDNADQDLTLYAQWEEYETQVALFPANPSEAPDLHVGNVVQLTNESKAGSIIIAGMKTDGSSIVYNISGLALKGGGADSIRVKLDYYMAAGSVIQLELSAKETEAPGSFHGLNIQTIGKKTIYAAEWAAPEDLETRIFTYIVKENDDLVGQNAFLLQRNNTVYLKSIWVGLLGLPTAIDNTKAAVKAVKVVRNGHLFIEKNGVVYNAQGAIVK